MINLIPKPKSLKELDGNFIIDELKIKSDFELKAFEEIFEFTDGAKIKLIKNEALSDEGYTLKVTPDEIVMSAKTKSGALYAVTSLLRICDFELGKREVPCCEIEDEPRFSWRGIHLDESRHFFGKAEVKRLLGFMLREKLNVFHWHLTDDNGWRIEIEKYPLLTEIGSKRKCSHIGGWDSFKCNDIPVEGFYTKEDIREIIAFAKDRGIKIVPEIDFPAHVGAVLSAYPDLACFPEEREVPYYFGGIIPQWKFNNWRWNKTLCLGKKETLDFVFGVLDEVCELFDCDYLHIGGDEAPFTEWKKCECCQSFMKENSLKDEAELQGWFENTVNTYLKNRGVRAVAWNDVLQSENLDTKDKNIAIQYWTEKRDIKAEEYVNGGGAMVLSNHQAFYFDMPYAVHPLQDTYNYTPSAYGVNPENEKNVLGLEGELWTEWIRDNKKLEMHAFPRILALGECAWSDESQKNLDDFRKRLDMLKPTLEANGIPYAEDEIAFATDKADSARIKHKFRKGNPYLEYEINNNLKLRR